MTYEEFKEIIDTYQPSITKEFDIVVPYTCWKYQPSIDGDTWLLTFTEFGEDDFEDEGQVLDFVRAYCKWKVRIKNHFLKEKQAMTFVDEIAGTKEDRLKEIKLTNKQIKVLSRIKKGLTYKEIYKQLGRGYSESTIDKIVIALKNSFKTDDVNEVIEMASSQLQK